MASYANQHPRDGRRITNRRNFIRKVGRGSHIAERTKLGYYIHYLVESVLDTGILVLYYGSRYNEFPKVHEEFLPFDLIDFELGVYLIKSDWYPESSKEKKQAIRRARSRIGKDGYKFAFKNSEHFVTWAFIESFLSSQTQYATKSVTAVGKEAVSQVATEAVGCDAMTTTLMETIGVGIDIYKLNKDRNKNKISEKDFQKRVCKKVTGAVGSIAGSTLGAAIGQVLIPIPGVGAMVGSAIFGLAGKTLLSKETSFLFDSIMN